MYVNWPAPISSQDSLSHICGRRITNRVAT